MGFQFKEDITTADIAFEANGADLNELFQSAAQAVIETMANPKTIQPNITKDFTKKADDVEKLLFEFLEEIIYLKDKDSMVFHDVTVEVDEQNVSLNATLRGDEIKPDEQELHNDVKAVTMHYYKVEKNHEWKTTVVLDV